MYIRIQLRHKTFVSFIATKNNMLVNRMNIFESNLGSVDQGHMLSIDSLAMSFNHMRASVGDFPANDLWFKTDPGFFRDSPAFCIHSKDQGLGHCHASKSTDFNTWKSMERWYPSDWLATSRAPPPSKTRKRIPSLGLGWNKLTWFGDLVEIQSISV